MPALPPVPKVVRITFRQVLQEDLNVINRIYYRYGGTAPTAANLATLETAVAASWAAHISPVQNTNINMTEVDLVDLSSATGAVFNSAFGGGAGTRAGATLTAAVCAIVKHTISRRYRGGHPRSYLWAGSETDIFDVQSWKPAFITELQNAWAAFDAANALGVWAGGGPLVAANVSYYSGFTNVTFPSGRHADE